MSKATLEFDLNEIDDQKEFRRAINATKAYLALHAIANEIFRPARKHGYSDEKINQLILKGIEIDSQGFVSEAIGTELISELESMFYKILEENGVDLNDLE